MNRLYVLYDAGCPMCSRFRSWLVTQPHVIPVMAVAAGSADARALLPHLDHDATLREITVVADAGAVWTGASAWVTCLWATVEHRDLATRLATPLGLPVARAMAWAAAGLRASLTTTTGPDAPAPGRAVDGSGWVSGRARGGGYADDCDGHCAPV